MITSTRSCKFQRLFMDYMLFDKEQNLKFMYESAKFKLYMHIK